jgi:hypothetical protein
MEVDRRRNFGALRSGADRQCLIRFPPRLAVACEHQCVASAAGAVRAKEGCAFIGEHDLPRLAVLAFADEHCAGVRIKVLHLEARKLAVAGAGLQGAVHQRAEVWVGGIDQTLAFGNRQVAYARCVDAEEWLERAPPRLAATDQAVIGGVIERGLENGQHAIAGVAASTHTLFGDRRSAPSPRGR